MCVFFYPWCLCVQIEGETVVTEALAGTRPRGSTAEEDAALAEELLASSKDRFENLVRLASYTLGVRLNTLEGLLS